MTKTILKTIGAAAMAALFCVTCGDSGPDRSLTNDGDVDGLLDRIHGKPADTTGGGTPPTPPAAKTYTLNVGTVSSNGARGGSVSRNPSKTAYDAGESVTVTATPDSNYRFTEWSGAASGTANPITITMDGNKTLTANFEWQGTTPPPPPVTTYKLTISINPAAGGSVSLNPDRSDYDENAQVAATATARTDYRFTGWSNAATGTANPITITMNRDKTLTANFEQIPKYTITFNYNNGSTNTTAITDTDGKLASLPNPTRNGYTFKGWYTAAEGGVEVTVNRVYTENTAIYAQWTANQVTPPSGNTFTDSRDGKTYKKVVIGTQTWMAENLNYDVPSNTTDVCYGNSADSCAKYGRLYNWATAMAACPSGWHLPLDAEWTTLVNYAGGLSTAGTKLKSSQYWKSYNGVPAGTDNYGFSALPGGPGNSAGKFEDAGYYGGWWSATVSEYGADYAVTRYMGYDFESVARNDTYPNTRLGSIRCVEGAVIQTPTTYTLTVNRSSTAGGDVSVKIGSGTVQSNPTTTLSVASGTSVTVTATPNTGYTFQNWVAATGTTLPTGITATSATNTFTISGNVDIKANFQQAATTTYTLTVSRVPADGGTTNPATSLSNIQSGTAVDISATPASTYTFTNWTVTTGTITIANANNAITTVTLTSNATIRANFTLKSVTPPLSGNTFTDSRDGKTYKKVVIGTQTWMAENLNYNATGSVCYGNSADSCARYGRLYNWETAMNGASSSATSPSGVQGVCPDKWHLPSDAEWTTLTTFVGGTSTAGTKLKSPNYWRSYSGNPTGTDEYGFSALPGGNGYSGGGFAGAGYNGYWWSATESNAGLAWYRNMNYSGEVVDRYYNVKSVLFSVRCVGD